MPQFWFSLVLAVALIVPGVASQEVAIPRDPFAALAAMPVRDAVEGGTLVRVVDDGSGAPLADADVLVITPAGGEEEQHRRGALIRALGEARGECVPRSQRILVLAAQFGQRYRTGPDGSVAVAGPPGSLVVAHRDGGFARSTLDASEPVRVVAPRWLEVRVATAADTPAAAVRVVVEGARPLRDRAGLFAPRLVAETGTTGHCRIDLVPRTSDDRTDENEPAVVRAMAATTEPVLARFAPDDPPAEPVVLQLPVCGQVRFILYDEHERPVSRLVRASLVLADVERARTLPVVPLSVDGDSCVFGWVEVGHDVKVTAVVEGLAGMFEFEGRGPERAGELVVLEGRLTSGSPILRVRVLDQQGTPVVGESIGTLLHAEVQGAVPRKWSVPGVIETDSDGVIEIPVHVDAVEHLYLVRRGEGEATVYRGAAHVELGNLAPGRNDLGEIRLEDESVVVRRRLVDETGAPVPGVWLRGPMTAGLRGRVGGAGRRFFEHRTRTDDQGWFEVRDVAPVDGEYHFELDGSGYWTPEQLRVAPHSSGPVRVFRGSTLVLAVAAEGLQGAQCEVLLRHRETGYERRERISDAAESAIEVPAGTYDVEIDKGLGLRIEGVRAEAGERVADPRLAPIAIGDRARWCSLEVLAPNGDPVPRAFVWIMQRRVDGSWANVGSNYTGADGTAVLLLAREDSIGVASQELRIGAKGFMDATIVDPGAVARVELAPVVPITVKVPGLPELPAELRYRVAAFAKPVGARSFQPGGDVLAPNGILEVRPKQPGTWLVHVYLEGDPRSTSLPLQRALHQRFLRHPVEFEFEASGIAPKAPISLDLDREQRRDLDALIEVAVEMIKEHREEK